MLGTIGGPIGSHWDLIGGHWGHIDQLFSSALQLSSSVQLFSSALQLKLPAFSLQFHRCYKGCNKKWKRHLQQNMVLTFPWGLPMGPLTCNLQPAIQPPDSKWVVLAPLGFRLNPKYHRP